MAPTSGSIAGSPALLVWEQWQEGGNHIVARMATPDGQAYPGPVRLDTMTLGHRFDPAVAQLEDGRFVVVWSSTPPTGMPCENNELCGVFGLELTAAPSAP